MDGYIQLQPTQIPMQAVIAISQLVEVRMEPHMVEQDIMREPPGGGKRKKKVGTQMVPSGAMTVQVSTAVQGYGLTFNNQDHAKTMYNEIVAALAAGGGVAQDLTEHEKVQMKLQAEEAERLAAEKLARAEQGLPPIPEDTGSSDTEMDAALKADAQKLADLQEGELDESEPMPTMAVGISDAATAEVEADGYDADPDMYNNEYTCVNCQCEYSYECADPEFEIACPECETINKPEGLLA